MAHPLPPDLGPGDLDAATLADDPLVPDPLVLPAVALPVPLRPEDALVEKAFLLRAQGSVVDRLWLLHLAVRPGSNLVAGCEADLQFIEELLGQCHSLRSWYS